MPEGKVVERGLVPLYEQREGVPIAATEARHQVFVARVVEIL